MYKRFILFAITIFILFLSLSLGVGFIFAQEATPTPTSDNTKTISDLQSKINDLQSKIAEAQKQGKTLSSQISVMDNQVRLTELRIQSTKQEIENLSEDIEIATKKISNLEASLDNLTKVLLNRVVATYQAGNADPLQQLMLADNASELFTRMNYLKIIQAHDKQLLYETQQAKNDYANQKTIFEDKKKKVESLKAQLEGYTQQLEQDKKAKQVLLDETKNDEKKYQQILAQARAEFLAIQGIVAGKGTEVEIRGVSEGQQIASIIPSASCNSSGPHLHFIVKDGGSTQNPFNYLKSVDYKNESEGDPFNPTGGWNWPIDAPIQFNQGYGSDTWYIRNYHRYPFHDGIDIFNSSHVVKAVKAGVLYRGSYSGYGGCTLPYVRVKHTEGGIDTLYLHVYQT